MLFTGTTDKKKAEVLNALGLEKDYQDPSWPLPNLKKSDEKTFWGWRSSYSFDGEAWCGSKKIGDEWATIIIFYLGHSQYIDGGFAVAIFRSYQKERVEYYEWKACDHKFNERRTGNCLHLYTCENCGKSYEVDSSG